MTVRTRQESSLRGDHPLTVPTAVQRRQIFALGVILLAFSVTTSLAAFSNPPADAGLFRLMAGWSWLDAVSWLDNATSVPVLVALSALLLLGNRCRRFLLVAATGLVATGSLAWVVAALVGRDHPLDPLGLAGDSYPGLGVVLLTILAGLVPPAVESATRSRAAWHASAALLGPLVVLAGLVEIHAGRHWPLDVVGAILLGAGAVVLARLLLEEPSRHPSCRRCPWLERGEAERPVPPVLSITERRARLLHRTTLAWVGALVVVYTVLALSVGMPRTPESGVMGSGLELPVQWGALTLIVVGTLVARRRHLTGALLVAFAAAVLGYAASVEYPPLVALAVFTSAWAPALMLWLEWHRRTSLRAALAAALAASIVLGGFVSAAAMTYSSYWGPTHPRSLVATPDTSPVQWMWAGAVTSTSADLRLRTDEPIEELRVIASEHADLSDAVTAVTARPDRDRVADVRLEGLRPDTRYFYGVQATADGAVERVQSFRTFPDGPASFTFAVGSCQVGGSNGQVFDAIRARHPLFMLATGDWTYSNIEVNDPERYREQYDLNLTAPAQAALYAETPVVYVWDDHDFGGNNANRTSPSRPAAMKVYRQMTPHYELAGAETPLFQAFTVGRVRFLVTDTRASRDPAGQPSGSFRSALGAQQREWLLAELAQADRYGLVIWVSPDPWVAAARPGGDTWGGFAEERRLIADAIANHGIDNLLMVSGDAHMLAFDDGTNTGYSTSGAPGFPLFQAAAVDRPGGVKGGPYSGPVLPGGGQFGTVAVQDDGTRVEVTLTGWNWQSRNLFTEVVTFPEGPR